MGHVFDVLALGHGQAMGLNHQKYTESFVFFATECANCYLDSGKLLTLLYYLDFDHYQLFGRSVTGDTYLKLPHGPAGAHAKRQLRLLTGVEGSLLHNSPAQGPSDRSEYVATRRYDLDVFGHTERDVLVSVAEHWRDVPAEVIQQAAHDEAPWHSVETIGAMITYDTARQRPPATLVSRPPCFSRPLTSHEREALIRATIASERLEGIELGYAEAVKLLDEVLSEPLVDLP